MSLRGAYLYAREETLARRVLLAPLGLLEGPYRLGAALHRGLYARGWLRRERLSVPVISVGNLTAGGSAKTPTASWLAASLAARGWRAALLSRGFGRSGREPVAVVSDGARVLLTPADAGDEPVWLAGATPGVPVLAGPDRARLGRAACERFGSEVLILDDGFQHHRLERDLDLVCVDAAFGLGNGRALPRGPLREAPRALGRASALIFTRAQPQRPLPELPRAAAAASARTPRFALGLAPIRLRPLAGGPALPIESLRGARVGLLAALARPETLRASALAAGAEVAAERFFPDHHAYGPADVAALPQGLRWITTGKDAVKLDAGWCRAHPLEVLEEAVPPGSGEDLLAWLLAQLAALGSCVRAPESANTEE